MAGALLLCALPTLAQPELKPVNGLPYPLVSPEEAGKLALIDRPIILHLRDVTLADALDELAKQSGVSLDTSWGGNPEILGKKLSLDLETRSFNEAFKAILDEADVKATLRQLGGRGAWNVAFNQLDEQSNTLQSGVGPFQLRLLSLNSNFSKSVTPTSKGETRRSQNNNLSINFGIMPDPQVAVIGASRIRLTRAEDEKGRSLRDETPDRFPIGFNTGVQEQVNVQLRSSANGSQKLAHLEGVAVFVLPTKREKWELNDVLSAKDVSHDFQSAGQKLTLTIQRAQKTGDFVSLDMKLSSSGIGNGGDARSPVFSFDQLASAVSLVDAKGQKLISRGLSGTGSGTELTVQARFSMARQMRPPLVMQDGKMVPAPPPAAPVLAEPLKLVFDVPTEFVQTEVPFSFADVPLP